jgi:serine/threonine protein kinase
VPGTTWCSECGSLVAGARIGDYRIVAYVGHGTASMVYLAEQRSLSNRKVVIKLLRRSYVQPDVASFRREAALLASLWHPYILPIYAYDVIEERQGSAVTYSPYLVLPYAEQGSLEDSFVQAGHQLCSLERVALVAREVGEALDYAHSRGVLHRDVKPANLLQKGIHVLLSDFSVASLIDVGTSHLVAPWAGSPAYMAPEVWALRPGRYSDQYALAVTCYRLLAGDYPWEKRSPASTSYWAQLHRSMVPRSLQLLRPDLPPAVDLVFQQALAKDPHERYRSVGAFAADLLAVVQELPQGPSWIGKIVIGTSGVGVSGVEVPGVEVSQVGASPTPTILRTIPPDIQAVGKEWQSSKHVENSGTDRSIVGAGLVPAQHTSSLVTPAQDASSLATHALDTPAQVASEDAVATNDSAPDINTVVIPVQVASEDTVQSNDRWVWGGLLLNLLICLLLAGLTYWQEGSMAAATNVALALSPCVLLEPLLALAFRPMVLTSRLWGVLWGIFFGMAEALLCALLCYCWTALALTIPHWGYDWQHSGDGLRIFWMEIQGLATVAWNLGILGIGMAVIGGAFLGLLCVRTQAKR